MSREQFKVLAVIPARGGSKGVPRKNVRRKPLIAYTIESALAARYLFHRVIVSSDDEDIAELARRYGAKVPFLWSIFPRSCRHNLCPASV